MTSSTSVSQMEIVRRRCPLLCERMSARVFLDVLAERNIRYDESMFERAVSSGALAPLETSAGTVFTRGQLLVAYQLTRHSRIEWYPWDDVRADREDLLARRVAAKRTLWSEIAIDAECVREFYGWLFGEDIKAFPASAAVRLTEIVRWSIRNIDASGHLFEIARANPTHRGNGSLLLISEMVKLRGEVESLLRNASEAGMQIPSASEVARDRDEVAAESRPNDDENPLYVAPPADSAAPDALARFAAERDLAIRTGDWPALVALLERSAGLFEGDRASQIARHQALATLYGAYLDDAVLAREHWQAMLRLSPGNARAITALDALLDRAAWAELLAEQCAAIEDKELAQTLLLVRARVLASELKRTEEALEAFGQALSSGVAARIEGATLLEELVRGGQMDLDFDIVAIDMLATLGGLGRRELEALFDVVEARAMGTPHAAELMLSRAELAESAGAHQQAFLALTRAISQDPTNERILDGLERLSAHLMNREELVAVLEDELDSARELPVRGLLAGRLGALLAELGRRERAIELLEIAHEASPEAREIVMQLAGLEQEAHNVEKAIAWLEKLRTLTVDPDERREVSEVLAELRSRSLESSPRLALDIYARRIRDDDQDAEATAGLLKIARGDDHELAAEAVRLLDPGLARSERIDELIELYERLVDSGTDLRAMLERLCQLLVRDRERKPKALERHAQLYAMRADPATLASARSLMAGRDDFVLWARSLQGALGSCDDDEIRGRVLRQIARTYQEQLRDSDAASAAWQQLLALQPADRTAYQALQRRFVETGQWQALVDLSLGWVEAVPLEKRATLLEVARVLADELGDTRGAYLVYEQLLDDALPGSAEESETRGAIDALIERTGSPLARLELLEEVEASASGERWVALRMQRVNAAAAAERSGEAIALVRELLVRHPGYGPAVDRLEALLRGAELWDALAEHLEDRIERAEGDEARGLMRSLANLLAERLDRGEEAREILARLQAEERDVASALEEQARTREAQAARIESLELAVQQAVGAPERVQALIALGDALAETGAVAEAIARMQQAVTRGEVDDPRARATLLVRMGQLSETHEQLAQAETLYKSALALQSSDLRFIDPLIGFYRRHRILAKLHALLKFRQSRTKDVVELAAVLAELADVAQQLGELDASADALESLLELAERGEVEVDTVAVRRNIAALLVRRGAADEALEELFELAQSLRERGRDGQGGLAEVLADIAALHLTASRYEAARAALSEGLALAPGHERLSVVTAELAAHAAAEQVHAPASLGEGEESGAGAQVEGPEALTGKGSAT